MSELMPLPMPISGIENSECAVDLEAWREKIRKSDNLALLAVKCWPTLKAMIAVFQEEILRRMHEEGNQQLPVVDDDGVLDGRVIKAKYIGLDIVRSKSGPAGRRIHDVKYNNSSDPFFPKEEPND